VQYVSELEWNATEDHCYFPEWADRPPAGESMREADRNSYLAGGYAEEFGHRAPLTHNAAPAIPAEEDDEWRVQAGCLHPGYPECPRPLDRVLAADDGKAGHEQRRTVRPLSQPKAGPPALRVILVGRARGDGSRHHPWSPWRELIIRRRKLILG